MYFYYYYLVILSGGLLMVCCRERCVCLVYVEWVVKVDMFNVFIVDDFVCCVGY